MPDSITPSSPDPDLDLFRQAQAGDFAAFEELVGRWQRRVYGVAYRILGRAEDAEDVAQQTFLSLIEHLDTFRGESSVAAWVLRIATNHAFKVLRKRRGLPVIPLDGGDDSLDGLPHPEYIAEWRAAPEALAESRELRAFLDRAIGELDDKHRVVFVLRDIEGLSTEETAAALGLSESNVKVRLMRARLQLRERLTREFGDDATRLEPHLH
jgi:RNA polymerase sigma-70 factor (ECF subfamily)